MNPSANDMQVGEADTPSQASFYYDAIRTKLRSSVLEGSALAQQVHTHLLEPSLPVGVLLPIASARGERALGPATSVATTLALLMLVTRWLDDLHDRDRPDQLWTRIGPAQVATLSADALNHAWGCLARDPDVPRSLLVEFSDLLAVLALGEMEDVTSPPRDLLAWQRVAWRKTAAGYRFAARAGALLHGEPRWLAAAPHYGEMLGLALQAADDFDGAFVGERLDLRAGAQGTLPMVLLRAVHPKPDTVDALLHERKLDELVELLCAFEIERSTEQRIEVYVGQARGALHDAGVLPRGPHLDGLLHALCQRG